MVSIRNSDLSGNRRLLIEPVNRQLLPTEAPLNTQLTDPDQEFFASSIPLSKLKELPIAQYDAIVSKAESAGGRTFILYKGQAFYSISDVIAAAVLQQEPKISLFIKDGTYEEVRQLGTVANPLPIAVTMVGESRDGVIIRMAQSSTTEAGWSFREPLVLNTLSVIRDVSHWYAFNIAGAESSVNFCRLTHSFASTSGEIRFFRVNAQDFIISKTIIGNTAGSSTSSSFVFTFANSHGFRVEECEINLTVEFLRVGNALDRLALNNNAFVHSSERIMRTSTTAIYRFWKIRGNRFITSHDPGTGFSQIIRIDLPATGYHNLVITDNFFECAIRGLIIIDQGGFIATNNQFINVGVNMREGGGANSPDSTVIAGNFFIGSSRTTLSGTRLSINSNVFDGANTLLLMRTGSSQIVISNNIFNQSQLGTVTFGGFLDINNLSITGNSFSNTNQNIVIPDRVDSFNFSNNIAGDECVFSLVQIGEIPVSSRECNNATISSNMLRNCTIALNDLGRSLVSSNRLTGLFTTGFSVNSKMCENYCEGDVFIDDVQNSFSFSSNVVLGAVGFGSSFTQGIFNSNVVRGGASFFSFGNAIIANNNFRGGTVACLTAGGSGFVCSANRFSPDGLGCLDINGAISDFVISQNFLDMNANGRGISIAGTVNSGNPSSGVITGNVVTGGGSSSQRPLEVFSGVLNRTIIDSNCLICSTSNSATTRAISLTSNPLKVLISNNRLARGNQDTPAQVLATGSPVGSYIDMLGDTSPNLTGIN